ADPELLQYGLGERVRPLARRDADRRAALDDRAMKQAARRRHRQQYADFAAAARLAEDRHVAGIAAEPLDIITHPTQRRDEIEHPGVARMRPGLAADTRQMQKAENIEAVVDADDDDIAAARQIGPVGHCAVARPVPE